MKPDINIHTVTITMTRSLDGSSYIESIADGYIDSAPRHEATHDDILALRGLRYKNSWGTWHPRTGARRIAFEAYLDALDSSAVERMIEKAIRKIVYEN